MTFTKKDALFSLIIGEAISWFLFVIARSLGCCPSYLWLMPVVLPFLALLGLYVAYLISLKLPVVYQMAKFALVGFSNAAIDFAVLNLLMWQTGVYKGPGIIAFNVISFSIAVINSFAWNKLWTFQSQEGNVRSQFIQFVTVALIGVAINTSIVYGITTFISPAFSPELWANFAKVLATVISLAWNFTGYKFLVFKK